MILISVGSNLSGPFGRPLASCRLAVAAISLLPSMHLLGVSGFYLTEPVPKSMQPDYVNCCAAFAMGPGASLGCLPEQLLGALHDIEARAGRVRAEPNASRTLDLDIIAIGDLVRRAPDPVLPHPRAHLRRFVLEPLREVAPDFRHSVLGLGIDAMLARLPQGGTHRLAEASADAYLKSSDHP